MKKNMFFHTFFSPKSQIHTYPEFVNFVKFYIKKDVGNR